MSPTLSLSKSGGRTLSREAQPVMRQVGWLGHTGSVYELYDAPNDDRERGGYSPLYIQIGTWEYLGDGCWGIRD